MLGINTNVASLTSQRNLSGTTGAMQTTLQRLSSGLRINSAKDDAAGLGISDRMTSQIRGLDQARRNANDGISLAQTAEGALSEIGNNLQRIRELAVQSANATNTTTDRASIQAEVNQLTAEMDRVATQTTFNGIKLLDGSFKSQDFQVGANAGQKITVDSISSARTADLGTYLAATVQGAASTTALAAGDVTINGVDVGATSGAGADILAAKINAMGIGVEATASNTVTGAAATAFTGFAAGDLKINNVSIGDVAAGGNVATQAANVAKAINDKSAATGVTATVDASNKLVLATSDGRDITIAVSGGASTATTGLSAGTTVGSVKLESDKSITIAGANVGNAGLTAATTAAASTGTAVSKLDLTTATGAQDAIKSLDAALKTITSSRSDLGAIQNRFSSTIANLQTTSENLSASRSRIMDADFAAETANLSRNQVLQQAGTAMLAQANQAPQIALQLLR